MRERPILFSAPMVRALLAGTKTQTRRVVRYAEPDLVDADGWPLRDLAADGAGEVRAACPYGTTGDWLWVRETCLAREQPDGLDGVQYLADQAFREIDNTEDAADAWIKLNHYGGRGQGHVVPSIHMPRWASRLTLEVTAVRVERLQDISDADAFAEGIQQCADEGLTSDGTARGTYRALWESINGPGSWDANPWVWVVEFRRI